jgi:hypothetical protein
MPNYTLNVAGNPYDIDFPYEAYDCQLAMMEKVVDALSSNRNALLESPTGASPVLLSSILAPRPAHLEPQASSHPRSPPPHLLARICLAWGRFKIQCLKKGRHQGLTLVYFSAQLKLCLTRVSHEKTPSTP